MRYRVGITIPAGTTQADPEIVTLNLEPGLITEVELFFPPGHAGLTYLQIYHQTRQIFPLTPGEAFRGDDTVVQFPEEYPIREVPYAVELHGWAPTATLDHIVFVGITVQSLLVPQVPEGVSVALPEGM